MIDCMTLLLQGDILTALTCPFTNQIGLWFFALMVAAAGIGMYIRYDNVKAPVILSAFSGILLINQYMPTLFSWILILALMVVTGTMLYVLLTRK